MGTSVTHTKSATWMVAPPDTESDVGEVVAGYLAAIGDGRAPALVRELLGRTIEAARRASATDADVSAALVAAVLDAVGSAAAAPLDGDVGAPAVGAMAESLRRHLERGAAASASCEAAAGWIPRIVGSVEGVVDQCGDDVEHVAILAATMALVDVGGGLDGRFGCGEHGPALIAAVDAAAADSVSCDVLAGMRALVGANAAFDTAAELGAAGDTTRAIDELRRARSLFLEAGLRVEASVTLVEQARLESETSDDVGPALAHYADARAVLVEFDRDVEAARADRDLAFAVAHDHGVEAAAGLVDAAADVFARYDLGQDLVLCDVVRACLARDGALPHPVEVYLDRAAGRLDGLGLYERAAHVRALAARGRS